jgi:hypothetical protein
MNTTEKTALILRCQIVLDYKAGKPFNADQLANLIEAEIEADRVLADKKKALAISKGQV